jgi:hypothetical protein
VAKLETLELVISSIAIAIPIVFFLYSLIQRLTSLETKFDCLLMWVLEIDPTENISDLQMKIKRDQLKKQIESKINGNGCKPPKA